MMVANNTSHLSSDCTPHHQVILNEAVSLLFFFLFPAALLLNGVAAWVSLHLHSNSTFIVYLKNLVAADLLMTLTLPTMAASMLPGAAVELKVFACRFSDVIFYCCLYTSIAFMGLISLDRFFKIVRPRGKMLGQNVVFSLALSALVWVMIFGCTAIPTIILTNQDPVNVTGDFCMSLKGSAGLTLHKFVVLYMEILFWLVSMLIVFCYIRITLKVLQSFRNSGSNNSHGKKKTKLRVFSILLVFFVCFVPLHIMRIPFTLHEIFNVDVCTQKWLLIVHSLALWVSTTNACLDPLLYIYLCREYRDKLADMMKARGICVGLFSGANDDVSQ
ncbi:LOW QUALITY PROTEIN: P2Y purinoceptor 14-like [Lates calcarifer]|uniref:LOW QUALITY PROTEIN: P2Y purinoceptor 14-like n=1 Tax=Lates calcarifer TaxID=8187 RepID=A0AAJ8AW64_LATCA|nr:LOW QUALITY PROTEIN: P2Y purinoceptor 14-like [Lates calcarifer]